MQKRTDRAVACTQRQNAAQLSQIGKLRQFTGFSPINDFRWQAEGGNPVVGLIYSSVSVYFDMKTAQNRRIKPSFSLPGLRSKRRVTPKLLLTR